MKKMTIGYILFGNTMTKTVEAIPDKDCNLSDCRSYDSRVTDDVKECIERIAQTTVPADCDFFIEQVDSENQVIDLKKADIYIAIPFAAGDIVYSALYSKNKPVIFYLFPYETIWSYGGVFYPYFVRDAQKIDHYTGMKNQVFVSKNQNNLRSLIAALHVKYKVNHTKALCIGEPMYEPYHSWNWGYGMVRLMQDKFGLELEHISSDKFLALYKNWDKNFPEGVILDEAKNNFMPQDYDSTKPEKMYNVFKELIKEHDINAFTVNCLYSVVHTDCQTTSCYALSKLNDEGIVSACEADITTLMNMLIVTYAANSPAFMLNPYLFPEDNKMFASHCTSPRKHSFDDDKLDDMNLYAYFEIPQLPCGIQIIKEEGPVTITGLSHDKMDRMIVIKANIVKNTVFASCRTQVELDVAGDIKEIVENYEGRHWALVYGDKSEEIKNANDVLGITTVIL